MRCASLRSFWLCAAAALLAAGLSGCFSFGSGHRDVDRSPMVNTGVGATILYPGEAPALPGSASPAPTQTGVATRGAAPQGPTSPAGPGLPGVGAPARAGGSVQGHASGATSGTGAGGSITMIGGAQRDERQHAEYREEPIWAKYVALPFAIAAVPFKRAAEALRGEPEPGPEVPRATPSAPVRAHNPPPDYETNSLRRLERELQERQARERAIPVGATPSLPPLEGAPPGGSTAPAPELSIAEELAALRRATAAQTSPPPEPAPPIRVASARPAEAAPPRSLPPPTREAARAEATPAHGIVDRNGDGRSDHWIYREAGEIVREIFDEDFDGRPDRTLLYDLETHQVHRVEEDADRDGMVDSWTDYRDGSVVRRRSDSDADGAVDAWSYYAGGRITRYEQDTTGDGFRDRVGIYRDGRLEREEFDRDGDGRLDRILHYDENEQVAREEEDSDHDGRVDVISHYESGRLARRELLDPSLLHDAGGVEDLAGATAAP